MGSSTRKKNQKAKDFAKPKFKVGKTKAKPANFTDTSFKAKSIVMGQQSLAEEAPDVGTQFKHHLSLASTSRSDKVRKEALAHLTSQVGFGNNPVGTATILGKLLPLISDASGPVRSQLLKLFRELPETEVRHHAEKCIMYIRAGMTHLSADISNDSLSVLEWLLDVAEDETVSCPGGWVKTLNSFCALMGWSVKSSTGWTSAPKTGLRSKDSQSHARQVGVLARFLKAGLKPEVAAPSNPNALYDNMYRIPRAPNPFAYLNLFGTRRDEEAEMYNDRESRQRVFHKRFSESFSRGIEQAKKEGGASGRSAITLEKSLKEDMEGYEPTSAVDPQDLLDLCRKDLVQSCLRSSDQSPFTAFLTITRPCNSIAMSFSVGEMEAALPAASEKPVALDAEGKEWSKPETYNYEEMAQSGPIENGNWEGNAAIYEWDEEYGEVGPQHPELELMLFGDPATRRDHSGLDFTAISEVEVHQEGETRVNPIASYKDGGLHPVMLENINLCGYDAPTPIQKYTIPAIHKGLDVVAVAQTGSGKTAAYLVPILNKLMGKAKKLAAPRPNPASLQLGEASVRAEPLVVVVCPTRELAIQIFNEARKLCYRTMLRPCVAYGGGPIRDQIQQLGKGCDVLIASPGRLCDFIQRPDVLSLRRLRYMVFDEADEILQDDWREEFDVIMTGGEQQEGNIKYMLFSATFPKALRDLAREHLSTSSSVRISVGRIGSTHTNILQRVIEVAPFDKKSKLKEQIESLAACRTIIFVNSKRTADELDDYLFNMGFPCTSMHSDRTQLEREASMRAFRAGKAPILIATGISARGIDVKNVKHVINYDLPSMDHGGIEEYTHRIGRTGRMGQRGIATSFYTERDEPIASVLVRTLMETKQDIPEFLEPFKPTGKGLENLKFETESDFDPEEAGIAHLGGGGWGGDEAGGHAGGDWGGDAGGDAG
ncbi:unnamed protein product, partial [Colletotrichum noveboracense]